MATEIPTGGPVVRNVQRVLEGLAAWWGSVRKTSLQDYVDVEMCDSDNVLVAHDFSMLSGMEIKGNMSLVGGDEFALLIQKINHALASNLREPGVTLEFTFECDPQSSK